MLCRRARAVARRESPESQGAEERETDGSPSDLFSSSSSHLLALGFWTLCLPQGTFRNVHTPTRLRHTAAHRPRTSFISPASPPRLPRSRHLAGACAQALVLLEHKPEGCALPGAPLRGSLRYAKGGEMTRACRAGWQSTSLLSELASSAGALRPLSRRPWTRRPSEQGTDRPG